MRRMIAVSASAALIFSLLTVPSAAVPIASKVELTSARIVARGVAVDLTFKIRCKDFDNRVLLSGELKQLVRKKKTAAGGISIGEDGGLSAAKCGEAMTTRVFANDWGFRRGRATVAATVSSCGPHDDEVVCREAKVEATVQVTQARQVPPESTTVAPGVVGVRLTSAKLAAKGSAIDFRFKIASPYEDSNTPSTFVYTIQISQVSRARVIRGYINTQYTEAPPNPHRFTLRMPRPQGVRKFNAREVLLSIYIDNYGGEVCCANAELNGVVRVRK